MSGLGYYPSCPPWLDVGHRWRMHRLWMNQELLHCQRDLWEESLGKDENNYDIMCRLKGTHRPK